jgi:DNA-binding response OmpR family regulator
VNATQKTNGETPMRIALLIDDQQQLARLLDTLHAPPAPGEEAMECTSFCDASTSRSALCDGGFELLIFDPAMNGGYSLALLGWLRAYRQSTMPVIVLSSRGDAIDVAQALDAGAQDYVTKPFRPIEFRARAYRFRDPDRATHCRVETSKPVDAAVSHSTDHGEGYHLVPTPGHGGSATVH